MRSVGIRQLKARLSEYVRLARQGELILVSDRDEIVAELGPVRERALEPESMTEVLEGLARRGHLSRATGTRKAWSGSRRGLGLSRDKAASLLADLRDDRW
jgi:antitoxin (DNA-binding transcriptional repressor) of toxin-antitoxin stability system